MLSSIAMAGLFGIPTLAAGVQTALVPEYDEKAALILRIAQFTDWPANLPQLSDRFVIGVLGADPFGPALDRAAERQTVAGRRVIVKRFGDAESLEPADLLFVCESHRGEVDEILVRLASAPTLTVADFDGFATQGGAVELFVDAGQVRFRVNREAAEAAGLNLRSQLLRSAASVD